jgi:cold shock CspA family protein
MGRSQESFNKKEVRNKKEKKRKDKEKKKVARKESGKKAGLDDMIAYVNEFGMITSTPPDPTQRVEVDPEEIVIAVRKQSPDENKNTRRTGVITYFDDRKGFGFIRDLESQEKIYVHVSNLTEQVKENNLVSYEINAGRESSFAVKVEIVRQPSPGKEVVDKSQTE